MFAIDVVGDELRFLDDPVELGVPAGEGDERLEPDPLGGEPIRGRPSPPRRREPGSPRLMSRMSARKTSSLLSK